MLRVVKLPTFLAVAALLVTLSPSPTRADEPAESPENRLPPELTAPSKHTGQVSFGFGTHGAFSQMSGIYSLSPRLYARYGLGYSQTSGHSDWFASSLTGRGDLDATQYFIGLGSPELFHLGGGIDVGAEVFMAQGALFENPWIAPGFTPFGFESLESVPSPFLSSWQRRAWMRDPSLSQKSWSLQFHFEETTDQGTRGAAITVGK